MDQFKRLLLVVILQEAFGDFELRNFIATREMIADKKLLAGLNSEIQAFLSDKDKFFWELRIYDDILILETTTKNGWKSTYRLKYDLTID